jgi:cytoskeleton-associated protein 5
MISSQDSLQSQALFNIKDSNKVGHRQFPSCNLQSCALDSYSYLYFILQEDRERRVLVRKFKFEEPRREQIDELKVCVAETELICTYIYISVLGCGLTP